MDRPAHALKANWSAIVTLKGETEESEFDLKSSWIKTNGNKSTLMFKGSDLRNQFSTQVEKIVVTATWSNHVGKSANSKKTLTRK